MPGSKRYQGGKHPLKGRWNLAKDRAAHEAARGLKMMTLADLSRLTPTPEEVAQLFPLMDSESDRGCALVAGCFLETAVQMSIESNLIEEKAVVNAVFEGATAPASSFSAKIKIASALGMFGPVTAQRIGVVKDIRNAFAHALSPLYFDHPTITVYCRKLSEEPFFRGVPENISSRERYINFCQLIFSLLSP